MTIIPIQRETGTSSVQAYDPFRNISALKIFEPSIKKWRLDDFEDFLLPALSSRSLLKDRMDGFKSLVIKDNPIKIETFSQESDKYVLTLNVQQFKPEELQVKITDEMISITAKHEEKKDEGNYSCQEFSRKHSLPAGVKAEDVKCDMSSDGILIISAPKVTPKSLPRKEVNIPIQHIKTPQIKV